MSLAMTAKPVNYDALINNPEFLNIIRKLIGTRKNGIRRSQSVLIEIEDLNNLIEQELKERE